MFYKVISVPAFILEIFRLKGMMEPVRTVEPGYLEKTTSYLDWVLLIEIGLRQILWISQIE